MDDLTKKQKGFVKDYAKTGNGALSIKENYDVANNKTATVMAVENLAKPSIQKALKSIADSLSEEDLIKVHKEGLQASEQIFKEGVLVAEKPDYSVRHKYLDSAYKLKGLYEDESRKAPIIIPILVKFLNNKDDTSDNGNTDRV